MSTLNPDRWQEVSPYLDEVLSLPEDERANWLGTFRKEKPALADLLQELLREQRVLIQKKFLEGGPTAAAHTRSPLTGQIVGHYRLSSPIGEGGMGSVWLAQRSDGRFERRAAVKFLHVSLAATGSAERFRREGRILGQLAHPHIAELIDAGVTESGEPYLVLEHVEGDHIDAYCDKHFLEVDARIRLFLDVLGAVAHAHSNLIVHRDIKPSNVLIRNDGQVKLLDFGIAKLLSDDSPATETKLTLESGGALTPQFAAPEQVTGGAITTATDVYGLGLLLYLLLTGQHPAGPGPHTPADMVKAIVELEPPRVSDSVVGAGAKSVAERRGTTPEKLRRQLRGDLDTIIGKALKKNPGERYRSVTILAEDLHRYLKHEPISARPDSFSYRASKFIYRNKIAVALTACALAGVATGIVAVQREARRAEYRFQQVRKLAHTVLFDLNPEIEQLAGSTKAREDLVKTSLEYLDSLSKEASRDPQLQLELATAYEQIGDVQGNPRYSNLGHPQAAVESYRKALAIASTLPRSREALEVLAGTYTKMGVVQAWGLGLRPEGRENLRTATTIADSIPKLIGQPDYQLRLQAHGFLGEVDELFDPVRAAGPLHDSLLIAREWVAADPNPGAKFFLAILEREWATILWETGDLNTARQGMLDSHETFAAIIRQDPGNKDFVREQFSSDERIGLISGNPDFFNLGDRRTATEWLERMRSSCERIRAADPNDVRAVTDLSDAFVDLAAVYRDSDPRRSELFYQKSIDLRGAALQSAPHDPEMLYAKSFAEVSFATLLQRVGKRTTASKLLQDAIEIAHGLVSQDPGETSFRQLLGLALQRRASILMTTGQPDESENDLAKSEEILTKLYHENSNNLLTLRELADSYRVKGDLMVGRSKWRDAELAYQKSLELWNNWTRIGKSSVYDQREREIAARLVRGAQKHALRASELPQSVD